MATFYPGDVTTDATHGDFIRDGYGALWRIVGVHSHGFTALSMQTDVRKYVRRVDDVSTVIIGRE